MDTICSRFPSCTHIMVVDFEATCGPGVSKTAAEIIEVGAVLYSFHAPLLTVDTSPRFHRYIKPQIVPRLTRFCTNLTGITQEQVDNGLPFNEMIQQWITFLADHTCTPSDVLFASWTDFDIKQLRREVNRSTTELEFPHSIDLQKAYKTTQKNSSIKSVTKALAEQNLDFIGREHSAIDDAYNTARLLQFSGYVHPTPPNPSL